MELFNIICGVCSVAGLLVSIFTAGKVVKISQTISHVNKNKKFKVNTKINKSEVHGDVVSGNEKR